MAGKYRKYEKNRIETNIRNFMSWIFDRTLTEQLIYLLIQFGNLLVETYEPLTELMKDK